MTAANLLLALMLAMAPFASSGADEFARKVFDMTRAKDFAAYTQSMDPRCHARPFTSKSLELRADILNKLEPGYRVEAMPMADYQQMMRKRGAPGDRVQYTVQPSHIVIVRGTVAGVAGGDHVALNPIVQSSDG